MNPANAAAHQLLAHVLAQQNNLAEAQNEITLPLRLRPSAQIHLDLGVVEAQQGNWEDATSHFRRAIVVDPGLAAAHMMLGIALRRQADHKGALEQFRAVAKLNPDDADLQYNLGRELKADGDTAGAVAAFRRAIELRPTSNRRTTILRSRCSVRVMLGRRRNLTSYRVCTSFVPSSRHRSF